MKNNRLILTFLIFILSSFPLMGQSDISIEVFEVNNELHDYGYEVGYLQFTYTPPDEEVWLSIGAQDEDNFDFGIIVENIYLPPASLVGSDPMTITIPFNLQDLTKFTEYYGGASPKVVNRENLRLYIHALASVGFYPFDPITFIYEAVLTISFINILATNGIYQGEPPEEEESEPIPFVEGDEHESKVMRQTEIPIIDLDASTNPPGPTYPGGDQNACVPASVSNSVMWMAEKYKDQFELPDGMTHRDVLRALSNRMNREANKGVDKDTSTIKGKLDFFEDLGVNNIEVKFQSKEILGTTPQERNVVSSSGNSRARNLNSRPDGKPQWDFLEKMMEDGEDVEISTVFYTRDPVTKEKIPHGHTMTVSGVERYSSGKKIVWVSDDINQSQGGEEHLITKPLEVDEWDNGYMVLGGQYIVTSVIAESPVPLDGRETAAFINELFGGSGNKFKSAANPFIEIALQASVTDLENYVVTIYDGADGTVSETITLDQFTLGTTVNGYNLYTYDLGQDDLPLPNGGVSVSYTGSVVQYQFISYGGEFYPVEGDAAYATSNDIGALIENEAFYLSGFGYQYSGFSWSTSTEISPGNENSGQFLTTALPSVPELLEPEDNASGLSENVTFSWKADSANYYSIMVAKDNQFTDLVIDEEELTAAEYSASGLETNTTYYWKVNAFNSNGESGDSEIRSFEIGATNIEDNESLPREFLLKQNYPNPFNPLTKVEYGLPEISNVEIVVYNLLGEEVSRTFWNDQQAGYHTFDWSGNLLPSGIYLLRMTASSNVGQKNFTKSIKMLLLK